MNVKSGKKGIQPATRNNKIIFGYVFYILVLIGFCLNKPGHLFANELPLDDQAWSFVVVADAHLTENRKGEPTGEEKFKKVLERIDAINPRPDFMLLLGDIHEKKLEPLLPQIKITVHPIAGNHEGQANRKTLRKMFPEDFQDKDFYTFEHKKCLFIAMCTAAANDHVGHFESQDITPSVGQCQWIEEQLKKGGQFQSVFLYGHIPPAENQLEATSISWNDSCYLLDLVRRYQPRALFFGHIHKQKTFKVDNATVYVVRSCNWNSRGEPTGFLHVKVFPNRVETEFIPVP